MEENYNKILNRIVKISGIEESEIEKRVEEKRKKLSGLISKQGALQVIAAELSISFDNEKLKIDELLPGMRKVNFSGQIIRMFPIRTFTTKDGNQGKVANIIVADDTSNIRVVLWDTNHIALLESENFKEGTVVEIAGGSMRQNEVHMGSFSEFKKSEETFENVLTQKPTKEKKISELQVGDRCKVRAFIVQAFDPRFFEANKETGRKITQEEKDKGTEFEKRIILNVVLDDGTQTINATLFHEAAKKLGMTETEDEAIINEQKNKLLGEERHFTGEIRNNSYFNRDELSVNDVEEIDLDKEIQ